MVCRIFNRHISLVYHLLSFKTEGTLLPVVTTQVPNQISTTTAIFRGTVNSRGVQTQYWFEYSTNSQFAPSFLNTTSQKSTGNSSDTLSIDASVKSLLGHTTYYYRTVAKNSAGTVRGESISFSTK